MDFEVGASVSVANVSLPVLQLPVSLATSTSVASISCQFFWLPVPRVPGTSVASASGARYFSCQCLCLICLLVPWLVSRFCAMVAEDITKPVAEDSCEMIVEDTHESSAKMSCISRPSSPQTTTDQVTCNTKNVMKI